MAKTAEPTIAPIDIAPFEMLLRDEQHKHLRQFHTIGYYDLTSKSTKSDMERLHQQSHLQDNGMKEEHTHTNTPVPTPDGSPISLGRTLKSAERASLKALVENDFLAMKAEIEQMANDMVILRRAELRQEWADKGADKIAFTAKANRLVDDYTRSCRNLEEEAAKSGVTLKCRNIYEHSKVEVNVDSLDMAIKQAEQEVAADKRRALTTLERSRLTAQRKVLMTGVTEEAMAILDTIPSAQSLMIEAAAARPKALLDASDLT